MSANEPTNVQPVAHTADGAETKPVVVEKYGMKRLIAAILLVCVTSLLLMCLVSGRWIKGDTHLGTWNEISIWGSCQCVDIVDASPCNERDRKQNAAKAFSVIAAGFEFFSVLVLLWYPIGKRGRFIVAAFTFLAACSLIITIALWGDLFNNRMCGEKIEDDIFHLDWAYGIRIAEFVFTLILLVAVIIRPHGYLLVFFAILILYLTVFTTTSRGWAARKVYVDKSIANPKGASETWEYGLWDYCQCQRAGVIQCDQIRRLLRASEAFEIIATAFAIVLTAFVVKAPKVPRVAAAVVAWFLFIFQILPWIFIAAVWNQKYCGSKVKDTPGFNLSWAFGIQVALSGVMIITAIFITIME
jgi:hypothetical protein